MSKKYHKSKVKYEDCADCAGCGEVADDDDRTPWKHWLNLPVASAGAILLGIVKPLKCTRCEGTGKVPLAKV